MRRTWRFATPHCAPARAAVVAAALVFGGLDLITGPGVQFPIAFAVPVVAAGYLQFPRTMVALAVGLTLLRAYLEVDLSHSGADALLAINAAIRVTLLSTLGAFAFVAGRSAQRVAALEGILPICSHCKRIRDDDQQWLTVERYITEHSSAVFSHGVCPACMRLHYGEFTKP